MVLKIAGKSWVCNTTCNSNCCSDFFLPLSPEQRVSLLKDGFFEGDNNYVDYNWLKFHKGIKIEKRDKGIRRLTPNQGEYEILFNEFTSKDFLYMEDKCTMLLDNGKCKIYRSRPQACQKSECILFSKNQAIRWYGKNGVLKDWKKKEGKSQMQ